MTGGATRHLARRGAPGRAGPRFLLAVLALLVVLATPGRPASAPPTPTPAQTEPGPDGTDGRAPVEVTIDAENLAFRAANLPALLQERHQPPQSPDRPRPHGEDRVQRTEVDLRVIRGPEVRLDVAAPESELPAVVPVPSPTIKTDFGS